MAQAPSVVVGGGTASHPVQVTHACSLRWHALYGDFQWFGGVISEHDYNLGQFRAADEARSALVTRSQVNHTGRRFQSESTLHHIEIVQILHDLDV